MESYLHQNQGLEDMSLKGPGVGYSMIRPNTRKAFIKNAVNAAIILILLIGLIIFINAQIGLATFLIIFETLGINITIGEMVFYIIILAVIICLGLLITNYLVISKVHYELYADHVRYYETQAFVLISSEDVSYDNVVRINSRSEGFMNKLLSCGDVIISLTNHKRDNLVLQSIDDPIMIAGLVQSKINDYNMRKQMQYQESIRINNIMSKF